MWPVLWATPHTGTARASVAAQPLLTGRFNPRRVPRCNNRHCDLLQRLLQRGTSGRQSAECTPASAFVTTLQSASVCALACCLWVFADGTVVSGCSSL